MRVTLLQQDIVWGDAVANMRAAEEAIKENPGSSLYVLPEMWSTGFVLQPESVAECSEHTPSLLWMQQMANKTGAAIAGSVPVECKGQFYNRFFFVTPYRNPSFYDKHHLFTYGGEHQCYTSGNSRVVIEWGGWHFMLQVCYDLRFPVWSRYDDDYDVIIYVASWPMKRRDAWDTLLKARAIENQCYVLGVNRVGHDPICQYNGGTVAIDAYGHVIGACPDNVTYAITVELDRDKLDAFRKKFPVLNDRDVTLQKSMI